MMNWLRLHSEARNDKKLATLTDAEHRVWFNLLCYASEQKPRGVVPCEDFDLLALEVASADADLLAATLAKLTRLRVLTSEEGGAAYAFANWDKRQYDKPSDAPDAVARRVAKHRQEKRQQETGNADATPDDSRVTPCNAQKRPVTPHKITEQNRTEQTTTEARAVGESLAGSDADISSSVLSSLEEDLPDPFTGDDPFPRGGGGARSKPKETAEQFNARMRQKHAAGVATMLLACAAAHSPVPYERSLWEAIENGALTIADLADQLARKGQSVPVTVQSGGGNGNGGRNGFRPVNDGPVYRELC